MKFILGKKIEMSQIFDKEGKVIPVTLIKAGPCFVTRIKTKESNGYEALQLGFEKRKKKKGFHFLREFPGNILEYKVGDKIDVSVFQEGDKVKVSGISKGKGFQGAVKRWGFSGRGATHGVKHEARTLGSVGSSFPQRVLPGKRMPGRTGGKRITVRNLKIVKIDKENDLMMVKGAVPGKRGTLLEIRG